MKSRARYPVIRSKRSALFGLGMAVRPWLARLSRAASPDQPRPLLSRQPHGVSRINALQPADQRHRVAATRHRHPPWSLVIGLLVDGLWRVATWVKRTADEHGQLGLQRGVDDGKGHNDAHARVKQGGRHNGSRPPLAMRNLGVTFLGGVGARIKGAAVFKGAKDSRQRHMLQQPADNVGPSAPGLGWERLAPRILVVGGSHDRCRRWHSFKLV